MNPEPLHVSYEEVLNNTLKILKKVHSNYQNLFERNKNKANEFQDYQLIEKFNYIIGHMENMKKTGLGMIGTQSDNAVANMIQLEKALAQHLYSQNSLNHICKSKGGYIPKNGIQTALTTSLAQCEYYLEEIDKSMKVFDEIFGEKIQISVKNLKKEASYLLTKKKISNLDFQKIMEKIDPYKSHVIEKASFARKREILQHIEKEMNNIEQMKKSDSFCSATILTEYQKRSTLANSILLNNHAKEFYVLYLKNTERISVAMFIKDFELYCNTEENGYKLPFEMIMDEYSHLLNQEQRDQVTLDEINTFFDAFLPNNKTRADFVKAEMTLKPSRSFYHQQNFIEDAFLRPDSVTQAKMPNLEEEIKDNPEASMPFEYRKEIESDVSAIIPKKELKLKILDTVGEKLKYITAHGPLDRDRETILGRSRGNLSDPDIPVDDDQVECQQLKISSRKTSYYLTCLSQNNLTLFQIPDTKFIKLHHKDFLTLGSEEQFLIKECLDGSEVKWESCLVDHFYNPRHGSHKIISVFEGEIPSITLQFTGGEKEGQILNFSADVQKEITFGRSKNNTIRFGHQRKLISAHHCFIAYMHTFGWCISEFPGEKSSNGTYLAVNDQGRAKARRNSNAFYIYKDIENPMVFRCGKTDIQVNIIDEENEDYSDDEDNLLSNHDF